jgi:hypothetical protein
MKWLDLTTIKEHLRIEPENTQEDRMLTIYGESAEKYVLNWLQRSVDDLKAMNEDDNTKVPIEILYASLLLVDLYYQQRSTVTPQQQYLVTYGFDGLVAEYRKGTYSHEEEEED